MREVASKSKEPAGSEGDTESVNDQLHPDRGQEGERDRDNVGSLSLWRGVRALTLLGEGRRGAIVGRTILQEAAGRGPQGFKCVKQRHR